MGSSKPAGPSLTGTLNPKPYKKLEPFMADGRYRNRWCRRFGIKGVVGAIQGCSMQGNFP